MSIVELQQQMQGAITVDGVPPALAGNARGLEVYRRAWRSRLIEALRTNFPVVHRVLGDADFEILADDYLRAHPSRNRSIRWFGDRLPAHAAAQVDALPHPAVVDLIRFEWAMCLAFDAANHTPLSFETLAALAPDAWAGLSFRLQPGYARVPLGWAVAPVWHAVISAEDPDAPLPPPEPLAHSVMVWRRGLQPTWRTLDPFEAELLGAVEAGHSFAELCEHAIETLGEAAPATVLGHLRQWVADEVLSA